MSKPVAIDLFCGLGGWTEGLLAEGYEVIGYDIEAHDYGDGKRYPAKLVLRDVLTIHGSEFKDAALIVASPPCQFFSYCAMPWSRAKQLTAQVRADPARTDKELALFNACFRIQREAIEAAGHFIPLVVENVRGAQPWVGRARWNFGSFYLWGDVPALMPIPRNAIKLPNNNGPRMWADREVARLCDALKTVGHINKRDGHSHTRHLTNQSESDGVKQPGIGGLRENGKGDAWFQDGAARHGSKSNSRKAASATIAKIPVPLSRWIGRVYRPK